MAGELSKLPAGWTVLHSVPVGRGTSDIDHVVIGPSGVFTINTKHHAGSDAWVGDHGMYVGGKPVDHLRSVSYEARRASSMLSRASGLTVPVLGLVTLVGVRRLSFKEHPSPELCVDVVPIEQLLDRLQSRRIFSDDQVKRIATAACRFETWHTGRPSAVDISPALAQFNIQSAPSELPQARANVPRVRGRGRRATVGCFAVIGALFTALMGFSLVSYLFFGH